MLSENEEVSQVLLNECLSICSKKKVKKIHLRGKLILPTEQDHIFPPDQHNKVRMFLELPSSSEALMNGFKSKLRSQIRKAEKNGLTFSWGTRADIDGYYAVFSENMRDLGSPVHSKVWFNSILSHYADRARLGIVRNEEEIVGGCILLSVGDKIAIPWASTLRKYNRLAPNMLLYWNVLKYAADAGFSTFDFGRSSEGEGTYRFKKQWGATPTPLNWYSFIPSSDQARSSDNQTRTVGKQIITEIWSKMPIPLANFFGPIIRRYINL
jgi:FemAB-related protein (PEP-CTERM system-associated)